MLSLLSLITSAYAAANEAPQIDPYMSRVHNKYSELMLFLQQFNQYDRSHTWAPYYLVKEMPPVELRYATELMKLMTTSSVREATEVFQAFLADEPMERRAKFTEILRNSASEARVKGNANFANRLSVAADLASPPPPSWWIYVSVFLLLFVGWVVYVAAERQDRRPDY